jgi:hypothetical protein
MSRATKKQDNLSANEDVALIRAYGEFWNASYVDWEKNKPRILGKTSRSADSADVDVYEERGIYILYKDYTPVYVGKADNEPLGSRLRKQRRTPKRGPRWDKFSWFGIKKIDENGVQEKSDVNQILPSSLLVDSLEALLILAINPLLNAREETITNAVRLYQSETDKLPGTVDRLTSIESKLELLLKHQSAG